MAGFDIKNALQMPAAVTIKKFAGIGLIEIPPAFTSGHGTRQKKHRDGDKRRDGGDFFRPPP
jgi:hypothetical protein